MSALGYPENLFFARNWQQMVEKDHFDNKLYVLSMYNVQLIL